MQASSRDRFLPWFVALLALALAGCGGVSETDLIGDWTVSAQASPTQAAKLSDEPLPDGLQMEVAITGQQTFQVGGRYEENLELQLRLSMGEQQVPLVFQRRGTGTWQLQGSTLVEVAEDVRLSALDTMTEDAMSAMPGLIETLTPKRGEAISLDILDWSPVAAELREQASGITYTLQKDE